MSTLATPDTRTGLQIAREHARLRGEPIYVRQGWAAIALTVLLALPTDAPAASPAPRPTSQPDSQSWPERQAPWPSSARPTSQLVTVQTTWTRSSSGAQSQSARLLGKLPESHGRRLTWVLRDRHIVARGESRDARGATKSTITVRDTYLVH
jgi:hypothetical protein